jgi:imidazole glycerol phosphate synthase glutamine amidotransferase subunit
MSGEAQDQREPAAAGDADGAPTVAVLDYGAGNLRSAQRALQRAGAHARLIAAAADAQGADALVVPGVGHFGQCVRQLRAQGFEPLLRRWAAAGWPVLGICVGMQILFESSEEDPEPGLGLLPGVVRRLPDRVSVPHMGWNVLTVVRDDPLVAGVDGAHAYFVHSYAPEAGGDHVVATSFHGVAFGAVVRAGSVAATQFHPEKSADKGRRVLANFLTGVAQRPAACGPAR